MLGMVGLAIVLDTMLWGEGRLAHASGPSYLNELNVPRALSDQYCAVYAVWHALRLHGSQVPVGQLAAEMNVTAQEGCNMRDIVAALRSHGVAASAAVVDLDKARMIDTPFIPYLRPGRKAKRGHFLLVWPTGSGRAVVLDGAGEPTEILLSAIEGEAARTAFQGEAVVIGRAARGNKLYVAVACVIATLVGWLASRRVIRREELSTGGCRRAEARHRT